MDWNTEKTLLLIELYKLHPELWDVDHVNYKNRIEKNNAWKDISTRMDVERVEIERKIKNLVGQYCRERRRELNSKKTGTDVPLYESKWFAYKSLMFLKDRNKTRAPRIKIKDYTDSSDETDNYATENETENFDITDRGGDITDSIKSEQITIDRNDSKFLDKILYLPHTTNSQQNSHQQIAQQPQQLPQTSTNELHNKYHDRSILSKRNYNNDYRSTTAANNDTYNLVKALLEDPRTERDEYTVFGDYVACKLRKLSTNYARCTVQYLINTLLWEAELGKYDYPPPNSGPYPECTNSTDSTTNTIQHQSSSNASATNVTTLPLNINLHTVPPTTQQHSSSTSSRRRKNYHHTTTDTTTTAINDNNSSFQTTYSMHADVTPSDV